MFCNQCGKQVADGTKFCPACGNQFKQTVGQQSTAATAAPSAAGVQPMGTAPKAQQGTPQGRQGQMVANPQRPMQAAPSQGVGQQALGTGFQGAVNGATNSMNGAMSGQAYTGYPPNWVGCLALIPNFKMCMTKKYASFTGRATRGEYWRFALANGVVSLLIVTLIGLIFDNFIISYGASVVLNLVFILPYLGVTIRRLHDTGRSGWRFLITFLPLVNIAILVFMLLPSTPGPNQYGPLPDYTYYEG